jgi:DNA-binding CsgD family transcriptional regulator
VPTSASADCAASARAVLDALTIEPVKLFVAGGIGTGKSTALEAVRRTLRDSGHEVLSRVAGAPAAAVVVDDAHLLGEAEMQALAELAEDPARTVVVAAEPREHCAGLRALAAVIERERARITLGPLSAAEVSHALADSSGHPPPPQLLAAALAASAGIPFLVTTIAAALRASSRPLPEAAPWQAAGFALTERLRRLDEQDLEALLIASLSTGLGAADLSTVLQISQGADLIDRARGTGLVQPSHSPEFLRSVHRATAQLIGAARHHEVEKHLLRTQLDAGTLTAELAVELAEHGMRDAALADWLYSHAGNRAGNQAGRDDLTARVRIERAALAAGADDVRAPLADALALTGDVAAAAALADALLVSEDPVDRAAGVRIAASAAAHDGNYAHAAELFDWLGSAQPDATVASAAVLVRCATGDLASAHAALDAAAAGPPTASARTARSLAEGIVGTIDGPANAAATRLGQALAGEHPTAVAMPDSGPALVTLAAIHNGDPVRARSVIGRAVRAGGPALFTARHRLLQGWVRMQDGQLGAAATDAEAAGTGLRGRDALWAAALRTAIARRGGDLGAVQVHWSAGMDVLAEYSVDLFSLLPLGELWIAGARLGQSDRLAAALEQGFGVLDALDRPASWAPLLHWSGVHAGILAGDPAAVAPHGQALTTMADASPLSAALAAGGRAWLRVLAQHVDADEVIRAARGLARFGLTSDATRLAGQAALQAGDPKVAGLMLQAARDLKVSTGEDLPEAPNPTAETRQRPASPALSDREREVAELLLLGMPYRDIGAQLFISAKTVEHHVARIRRRLGAQSRSEMLSMLRAMLTVPERPANGKTAVSEI